MKCTLEGVGESKEGSKGSLEMLWGLLMSDA